MRRSACLSLLLGCGLALHADEVKDWNRVMFQAALTAGTSPIVMTRVAAIVQASVFDAVNGIERRYTPVHVAPAAPPGASQRAAAVAAAHAALVKIYPAQQSALDAAYAASLAGIASEAAAAHSQSIARGVEWGEAVANAIWTWRGGDGITPAPPPFLGGAAIGEWRPTPPAFAPGAVPQFAHMTPWVIAAPSQFRAGGPPLLTSPRYAADLNEVKALGSATSATRTADQTIFATFWASTSANSLWNDPARSLAEQRHFTLSENAHLLALLNLAMADAALACWEAKYHYVFWRPITAIGLADFDGNPDTVADPAWQPLLVTPAFPEYSSGHSTVSGAAGTILASVFGENTAFVMASDGMPGVVRSFTSFSAALAEVNDARVFAGIHFRSAVEDGAAAGRAVARYVLGHGLLPTAPGQAN